MTNVVKMQTISKTAIDKIKENPVVTGRLIVLFKKSASTIERWINNRDIRLITPQALQIISQETGLSKSEILENESRVA
jgi:hypothetical protein